MTDFVIDASVARAWCFDDEATPATRALLERFENEQAVVPLLWHLELANALATSERKRRISPARTIQFVALISRLPVATDSETPMRALGGVLDLARSERLSAYDASYLELAVRRGIPLATKDEALAKAATRVGVRLLAMA